MKKLLFGTLMLGLSTMAFAGPRYDHEPMTYSMPEPGGIIELAVGAVGLGVWAWRRR